jgi:ribosomal small subunit protein bTHX
LESVNTLLVLLTKIKIIPMGRGDKKSGKGKRTMGSYGVTRNRKNIKAQIKRAASKKPDTAVTEEASAKPKRTAAKKKAE